MFSFFIPIKKFLCYYCINVAHIIHQKPTSNACKGTPNKYILKRENVHECVKMKIANTVQYTYLYYHIKHTHECVCVCMCVYVCMCVCVCACV